MRLKRWQYLLEPQQLIDPEHTVAARQRPWGCNERLGEDKGCFNT